MSGKSNMPDAGNENAVSLSFQGDTARAAAIAPRSHSRRDLLKREWTADEVIPHHNHDEGRVLTGFGAVHLSDNVLSILALVAAHDGVSPDEWLARAVVERGNAIGLNKLQIGERA